MHDGSCSFKFSVCLIHSCNLVKNYVFKGDKKVILCNIDFILRTTQIFCDDVLYTGIIIHEFVESVLGVVRVMVDAWCSVYFTFLQIFSCKFDFFLFFYVHSLKPTADNSVEEGGDYIPYDHYVGSTVNMSHSAILFTSTHFKN